MEILGECYKSAKEFHEFNITVTAAISCEIVKTNFESWNFADPIVVSPFLKPVKRPTLKFVVPNLLYKLLDDFRN